MELNAGTGSVTNTLVRQGHRVIATDPDAKKLAKLRARVVPFAVGVSGSESIPSPSQSVDIVIANPSSIPVDRNTALAEIHRVLRPQGTVGLMWSQRDESVPWVRRLGRLLGDSAEHPLAMTVRGSELFDDVEETTIRSWQRVDRADLLELAETLGISDAATLSAVGALYDDYDRGPDGLQLPYVLNCLRARAVTIEAAIDVVRTTPEEVWEVTGSEIIEPIDPPDEPGTLLIDFP